MTTHPHQALNGHIHPFAPRRNALSAAFALLKQDIQSAGKALQAAEQRAQEFQNILDLLEDDDGEEDPEKPQSLACEIGQEIVCAPVEEIVSAAPKENSQEEPAQEENSQPEFSQPEFSQPEFSQLKENSQPEFSQPEFSQPEFSQLKENSQPEFSQPEFSQLKENSQPAEPSHPKENSQWHPPQRPSTGPRKSFIYKLIGERSELIHGWLGNAGVKSLFDFIRGAPAAASRQVLGQIADVIESGDIRWAGQKFASHTVQLRWLFPYLPPKFADAKEPSSLSRLISQMDLYRQLNDLCRDRTVKSHETKLKNGYPSFHRSDEANEELEQFARKWFNEQMLQRAEQTAHPPAEPAAAAPARPGSLDDARAIAVDPSQWTMETMPIIYHGVTLWPPEPDKINPISRTDAEIAYWLAHEYLIEVRRLRGKNPRIDGMDLRQKFKYLKKIPANNGVIRGLHIIANIVNNDIGTDADNRIPRFEVNMV
jgi:hypothetical protein